RVLAGAGDRPAQPAVRQGAGIAGSGRHRQADHRRAARKVRGTVARIRLSRLGHQEARQLETGLADPSICVNHQRDTENDMATNNDVTANPVASAAEHGSFYAAWPYWLAGGVAVIGLLGLAFHFAGDGTQPASAPSVQTDETVGMRTPIMTSA